MAYLGSTRINIGTTGVTSLVTSANPMPISDAGGSVTVDGPLTDAQLRATSVPVEVSQQTGFGEVLSGELTPFVQSSGHYNLLPANLTSYTASGGGATVTNQEFTCTTGTSSGGYGAIRSIRSVNYKGGMAAEFRGTGRFTAGVADSIQGVGMFNVGDTLAFGYYGTSFGIIYQHGGKPEVRTLTITVGSGGSTNATVVVNSVSYTIPLTAGTVAHNAFEIAAYLTANQTAFTCTQNGATVVCIAASDGAKSGTYSFSHATASASWAQTTLGVTKTTVFKAQADWNVDTASWLSDKTKGNVFKIVYQYLGYGAFFWYAENPSTGKFTLVHITQNANTLSTPTLGNPALHGGVFAASLGSTTALTTSCACFSLFIQGTPGRTRNPRAYSNSKSVGTTLTNVFTVRNRNVFGGIPNQIEIEPNLLTAFTESTKGARIAIYASPTVAGEPNFSYLADATLVSEIDTAGTSVTGGTPLLEFKIAGNSTTVIPLDNIRIRIPPGFSAVCCANVVSGAASDTSIALVWYEDI